MTDLKTCCIIVMKLKYILNGVISLLNKAFNIVEEQLNTELSKRDFKLEKNNLSSVFSNGEVKYKLEYNENSKKFILSFCNCSDENYKNISVWLFDPKNDSEKEAKSIANDFVESISVSKKNKNIRKANKKSIESNSDLLFLANRFATVFPELKEDIKFEKENFETFRGITFTREKILPLFLELINSGAPADKFKKVCSTLNNLYDNGNLDVRSCVTIVILNSVPEDNKKAFEKLEKNLSSDLLNAWNAAKKYKNKKVKPEKVKKRKSFFEKALQNSQFNQ